MMHRTQITLPSDLQYRARRRASEQGISLAEYIRRLVDRDTEKTKSNFGLDLIIGMGASAGGSNVARDKDQMIGEAIAAYKLKR